MADPKDATPRPWRIDAEHLAEGARVSELTKPDSRNGINNLYLDLRDARAELAEATRLLRKVQVGNGPLWSGQVRAFLSRQGARQ